MSRKCLEFGHEIDGKKIKFKVLEPTLKDQKESNKVRNEAFNDALLSKAPLRSQLNSYLKAKNEWDDEQQKQFDDLTEKITQGEAKLAEGGFSLEEARQLALDMQVWRTSRREMLGEMGRLDSNTAEGQADNMAFNYLVSACLVYNNKEGKEVKYFKTLEDYLNQSTGTLAFTAASKLATLMHGVGEDIDKNLPENRFLLDFDFVDEELRLVDKEGRLIDVTGHLINEDGRLINEKGELVDRDGHLVDEAGEMKVEYKGFINEDGETVLGKSRQPEKKEVEETEAQENTE